MKDKQKAYLKGFTLVEILFALFFLTVGVFGVYALIINNQRILEANKNYATALMLGEQGLVFGEAKNENSNENNINDKGTTASSSEQSFNRKISIDQSKRNITSEITWIDTLGPHTKTFTTDY